MEPFLSALYDHSIPEVNNMDQQAPVIAILPRGSLSHVCITLCVCVRACMFYEGPIEAHCTLQWIHAYACMRV